MCFNAQDKTVGWCEMTTENIVYLHAIKKRCLLHNNFVAKNMCLLKMSSLEL